MLKRVDLAVINVAELAEKGEFPGGEITRYGLADDAWLHLQIHAVQFHKMYLTKLMQFQKRYC